MSAKFNPYTEWLGIPESELPANYYVLLGLNEFESNSKLIDRNARLRIEKLQDIATGSEHVEESQRILNQLVRARVVLMNPGKRQSYNERLYDGRHDSGEMPTVKSDQSNESEANVSRSKLRDSNKIDSKKSGTNSNRVEAGIQNDGLNEFEFDLGIKQAAASKPDEIKKPLVPRKKRKSDLTFILGLAGVVAALGVGIVLFLMKTDAVEIASPFKSEAETVDVEPIGVEQQQGSNSLAAIPPPRLQESNEDMTNSSSAIVKKQIAKPSASESPKTTSEGVTTQAITAKNLSSHQTLMFERIEDQPLDRALVFSSKKTNGEQLIEVGQEVQLDFQIQRRDFQEQKREVGSFFVAASLAPVAGDSSWIGARGQFAFIFVTQGADSVGKNGKTKSYGARIHVKPKAKAKVTPLHYSVRKHEAIDGQIVFSPSDDWGKKGATIDFHVKVSDGMEIDINQKGKFKLLPTQDRLILYISKASKVVMNHLDVSYPEQ